MNPFQLYPENSLFLEMECTFPFDADHPWDEAYWYTEAYPQSASGSKIEANQLFLFLKQQRGSPGRKKGTLQTQDTVFQQSGNILTIRRGHFFLQRLLGFLLWVIDTLQFCLISPKNNIKKKILNQNLDEVHFQRTLSCVRLFFTHLSLIYFLDNKLGGWNWQLFDPHRHYSVSPGCEQSASFHA